MRECSSGLGLLQRATYMQGRSMLTEAAPQSAGADRSILHRMSTNACTTAPHCNTAAGGVVVSVLVFAMD
jgi:hypothetical protein